MTKFEFLREILKFIRLYFKPFSSIACTTLNAPLESKAWKQFESSSIKNFSKLQANNITF